MGADKIQEARDLLHWGEPERDMQKTHIPEHCERCQAMLTLLRAERVRVLEMLDDRISHPDNAWATLQSMLSSARADGAPDGE